MLHNVKYMARIGITGYKPIKHHKSKWKVEIIKIMQNVTNKLRVVHFPQVGSEAGFFEVAVKDEEQAAFTINLLAD